MADRFPLIVNESSRKIEEMGSNDNLDLSGNGIAINGSTGVSGQYLKSDGGVVVWDNPGDVYLTATQTITNKTFEQCSISGSVNAINNLPNSSLVNSGITLNGVTVDLGGSITTPNDNTTYSTSLVDGATAAQKIFRLTAAGSGSGDDDITFAVANPSSVPSGSNAVSLFLDRSGDVLTFSGHVVDNNTVTRLQAFSGGTLQSGDISIKGAGGATVTQDTTSRTITIDTRNDDTITQLRVGTGGVYADGDFTFLDGGATSVTQAAGATGDPEITISSTDTVTRVRGGSSSSFLPSTTGTSNTDVTFIGGTHRDSSVSVIQNGNSIEIDAFNTDTITKIGSNANNGNFSPASGDFRFTSSGDAELNQTTNSGVTEIDISFTNTDTGALLTASGGIVLNTYDFSLKNSGALSDQTLTKWDSANGQLVNSIISDNGSAVTITGDLNISGTTTTINSTVLQVADPIIELRRGNNLTGANAGIQVNRTTDNTGAPVDWTQLSWNETGSYWRTFNSGGQERRLVTESEIQTLTNKTLDAVTLTGASNINNVTAGSINGLTISSTVSSTLTFSQQKTVSFLNSLSFSGTDGITVDFGTGPSPGSGVAYTSDSLNVFAPTTSTQFRGVISDGVGTGSVVFNDTPRIANGFITNSTTISLFDTNATTINAFGAATTITIGSSTGTATFAGALTVDGNVILNSSATDDITINGIANFENNDIVIRGTDANPMRIGRGTASVSTNTVLGVEVLENNTSGSQSVGIGYQALQNILTAQGNVAVGNRALKAADVGFENVAVGKDTLISLENGDYNVAIGESAGYGNTEGSDNVYIGAFAGYNSSGSGNVLIGSSGTSGNVGETYSPPVAGGDKQLVIASGADAWIFGDNTFNVTLPNNLSVGGDATINGNLVVNGTTTTINTQNLSIDDNAIELSAVTSCQFSGNIQNNSPIVTNIDNLTGLVAGMDVGVISGTSLPAGTTILSVDLVTKEAELSNPVSGASGVAVFNATGPTDFAANGGGIILKGTSQDKTILYDHDRTEKYWVFSENLEILSGKQISIANQLLLSGTTLGSTVVNSSLTSVGTLTSLDVSGAVSFGGRIKESNDNEFTSTLTPVNNILTIDTATSNTVCGTPSLNAINEWAFTNVNLGTGESFTLTVILNANTSALYGDACSVDGVSITNGVEWSGGSPPLPTTNTDILTFIIVRDGGGTTRVFGQGNTDFS